MTRKIPRLTEDAIREILSANGVDQRFLSVVAIRGYYLNSMGVIGANDRRIYDDAQFVVWPDGMAAFQANTDPNGYRKGHGTGSNKGMAMLKPGIHLYGPGMHRPGKRGGHMAFVQCERFTVIRDGDPPYEHLGHHYIHWHSGGKYSTSSLGCQTNKPGDWAVVKPLVYNLLERYKNPKRKSSRNQMVRCFPYVLMDETERRKGNLIVSNRYL